MCQIWLATVQGVDYVNTRDATDYADAWTLPDADLCADQSDGGNFGWRTFQLYQVVKARFIFAAGPNAHVSGASGGQRMMSSMMRTANNLVHEYCTMYASHPDGNLEEVAPFVL
ncbi:hypothetical protein N9L68_07175 [bacterium]|nr:hypothetical protein [bacterium]